MGLPMQGSGAEFFSECCSNSLFSNTTKYSHFKDFYFHSGFKSFVSFLWTTCFAMRQKCECFLPCGHFGCEQTKAMYQIFFCIGHSLEWCSDSEASRCDRIRSSREVGT